MDKEKIESFDIIGIAISTTNENGRSAADIGNLWGKFMSENILDHIPSKVDNTIYSVYMDYEGDHTQPYTAVLGCKVKSLDSIPNGMVGVSITGGDYIKTTAKGDLTKGLIGNHWSKIFELGLERTFAVDFEVYGEKAQNPPLVEVDFYVGVNH